MEQRITELVNLVQTQGNQIQTLADELREVNRKNTLLENNLKRKYELETNALKLSSSG